MPFVNRLYENRLSDLVVHESMFGQSVGYSRDSLNVTPPASSGTIQLGTVVYRAKSFDVSAPWTVMTDATPLVSTNEFAVVMGDQFKFRASAFIPNAIVAGEFNAVAFTRNCILKEYFLKQIYSGLSTANFALLKGALRAQGVIVEATI